MAESRAGRHPGLHVAEDPEFDRIQWRVERIAWVTLALVLGLVLLGFLGGGGPLTRATETTGEAEVSYNRMVRFQAPLRLQLSVPAAEGEARVTFNGDYLDSMSVEGVHPEPDSVEAGAETTTYVFALSEGQQSAAVTFTLRPERIGVHSADVETDAGTLSFWQFALP